MYTQIFIFINSFFLLHGVVVSKSTVVDHWCNFFFFFRYKIGGDVELPHFAAWVQSTLGVELATSHLARPAPSESEYPKPITNAGQCPMEVTYVMQLK